MAASFQPDVKTPSQIGPYVFRGTIGEGAFSVVKLCYHTQEAKYYACKVVPKARLVANKLEKRFEIEIRIDQQLHHPGIVALIEIMQDDANFYLIMEFCPNGELFQYIVDRKKLSEDEARSLILQVMDSVNYIHKMGVSHRDLKPENILVDQNNHLKISDFGLSRFVGKNGMVETPCGSPCYASPECISGKPYNGKTNDVWSVGVILYAMVTGQLPWTKRNQTQLFEQIKQGEYTIPHYVSKDCGDLLKKLMTVDSKKRITLEKAMEHPWFANANRVHIEAKPQKLVSLEKVDQFFCRNVSFDAQAIETAANTKRQQSMGFLTFERAFRAIHGKGARQARSKLSSSAAKAAPSNGSASSRRKPMKAGTKEDTMKALENARRAALKGSSDMDKVPGKPVLPRSGAARKSEAGLSKKPTPAARISSSSSVSRTATKTGTAATRATATKTATGTRRVTRK